ncbi:hypothetical protein PPACK8108_LOCUS16202 [Phakopsora pachyrhizi]|uniref:Uncharacterized protein n=1 Tax=Phakopsora pachyrhizi TaxID=170000 RepID=A0AAV0BCQ2_PHAPC|nr:hypothetical protein PPACK8108_LOCUS16202 [Phakopsora pachyrhizi]
MTAKIGPGDLESTDQRGRIGAAEDIELIDRMRFEYCFTDEILDFIYKKILPLELTVKKNYFNVDEIKPDVYSAAKGLCGDGTRRETVLQPTQTEHKKVLSILGEGAKARCCCSLEQTTKQKKIRIRSSNKGYRPDQLEDSINDPNDWFSTRILNLTSSKGVRIQLKCVGWGQTILSLGEPNQSIRWFALPSEDWQGFIEYWICHDENDQHQSDGSGKIRDPKEYKGFIGDFDLRFDRAWIKSRHSERGWKFTRQESDGDCVEEDEVLNGERSEKGQEKIIPTILERGGGVDLKTRLECKSCLSELVNLIGQV